MGVEVGKYQFTLFCLVTGKIFSTHHAAKIKNCGFLRKEFENICFICYVTIAYIDAGEYFFDKNGHGMNILLACGIAFLLILLEVFLVVFRAIKTFRKDDYPSEPYPSSNQERLCSHMKKMV